MCINVYILAKVSTLYINKCVAHSTLCRFSDYYNIQYILRIIVGVNLQCGVILIILDYFAHDLRNRITRITVILIKSSGWTKISVCASIFIFFFLVMGG